MSYPDPTQPFPGNPTAFWQPPFWVATDHHQQPPPDLATQFDHRPPFKRSRTTSEKPPNFPSSNPRVNPSNPLGSKGTSHIFYKTRMCAKFMEGTCKNGDQCTFAHGQDDLREPPPNWQEIVREKDRGSGASNNWSGGNENDQRSFHRMKICMKYYNGEECPYGDGCNFLHERGPPPPMPARRFRVADVEQRESSAISIGVTGVEGRGSGGCDFDQRVLWKTRVCSKWETGNCPFGEKCHYAHGQSELRFSGIADEADQLVINACSNSSMPRNLSSVTGFSTPAVNLATPVNGDGENKNASKWKLTKKINRIYADWLDDADPPHCSANQDY